MSSRGVRLQGGKEVACDCSCHVEPAIHFMPCCYLPPKTEEGQMSLNACLILEGILATHGAASAQLATFRQENPGLASIIDQEVRRPRCVVSAR
jgi:hypothetical protein